MQSELKERSMVANNRVSGLIYSAFHTRLRWSSSVDSDMVCGVFASFALLIVVGVLMLTPTVPDSSPLEDTHYVKFSTAPTVPVWQMPGFRNPFKHADSALLANMW